MRANVTEAHYRVGGHGLLGRYSIPFNTALLTSASPHLEHYPDGSTHRRTDPPPTSIGLLSTVPLRGQRNWWVFLSRNTHQI